MDNFLKAAIRLINKHGKDFTYMSLQTGAYNATTLSTTNTSTSSTVKMYKNHIKTNQYQNPGLVGKEAVEFYLANNSLSFTPKVRDKVQEGSVVYTIESIKESIASGATVMFVLTATKG
jgi:N-acetylmuramoyl-L-alanine amidase CwlA